MPNINLNFPLIKYILNLYTALIIIILSVPACGGSPPSHTITPTPNESFSYLVRVQAEGTGTNIENAKVTIEVTGRAPLDEITGTDGLARIFIDASYSGTPGRLLVEANGYEFYRREIDLYKDNLPDIILLSITPTATPLLPTNTPISPPTHTPVPSPPHTLAPTITPPITTIMLNHRPVSSPPSLYALVDNLELGVIPLTCARAIVVEGDPLIYPTGSEIIFGGPTYEATDTQAFFQFDLVTDRTLSISAIDIKVNSFLPPPTADEITQLMMFVEFGMGGVPIIVFPNSNLHRTTTYLRVDREEGSLRLDPGDAVTFVMPLTFVDPGLYEFQFVVIGEQALGKSIEFVTLPVQYGWFEMNDLTQAELSIPISPVTRLTWADECP